MQNLDFYQNKSFKSSVTKGSRKRKTVIPNLTQGRLREQDKMAKGAVRIIFIIVALCIISFTTGLALGIKFAGGTNKEIVDQETYQAVTETVNELGDKVSNLIDKPSIFNDPKESVKKETGLFSEEDYPYVIKVGQKYDHLMSQKIADFLSEKGHRVILSKKNDLYFIFAGPYPSEDQAKNSLEEINTYKEFLLASNSKIIKR